MVELVSLSFLTVQNTDVLMQVIRRSRRMKGLAVPMDDQLASEVGAD
jgi:hypothetical protein